MHARSSERPMPPTTGQVLERRLVELMVSFPVIYIFKCCLPADNVGANAK